MVSLTCFFMHFDFIRSHVVFLFFTPVVVAFLFQSAYIAPFLLCTAMITAAKQYLEVYTRINEYALRRLQRRVSKRQRACYFLFARKFAAVAVLNHLKTPRGIHNLTKSIINSELRLFLLLSKKRFGFVARNRASAPVRFVNSLAEGGRNGILQRSRCD